MKVYKHIRHWLFQLIAATFILSGATLCSGATLQEISRDPYAGAIAIDAATGTLLFQDNADAVAYPASMVKLMDLLVIVEMIERGDLKLTDHVRVNAEAAKTGGSQVWLKENEIFSIDDMLYALMVQSANDAAAALAIHIAGSREGFTELMNRRARELGMRSTIFRSVHGLPPDTRKDQYPDITTPRDMTILCRELLKHPEAMRYVSTWRRDFRGEADKGRIDMVNHNHLLKNFEGCDGFKTGYFRKAGFSVSATAERSGQRVIAVVMGSKTARGRDQIAAELMAKGLATLAKMPPPPEPKVEEPQVTAGSPEEADDEPQEDPQDPPSDSPSWVRTAAVIASVLGGIWFIGFIVLRNSRITDNF